MTTENDADAAREKVFQELQITLSRALKQIIRDFENRLNENEISIGNIAFVMGSGSASLFYEMTRLENQPLGELNERQIEALSRFQTDYQKGYERKIKILSSKELLNDPDVIELIDDSPPKNKGN